jgi:hypothetical protein
MRDDTTLDDELIARVKRRIHNTALRATCRTPLTRSPRFRVLSPPRPSSSPMAGPRRLLRLDEREPPTLPISRLLRTRGRPLEC